MENALAILVTYSTLLVDGNPITNLLSIGGKTPLTGPDPPGGATIGGLNEHGLCEGGYTSSTKVNRIDEFANLSR
jgi:hypothetical protein